MTGYRLQPPGSSGCLASRIAPGGGTNDDRIALALAAARCLGVALATPTGPAEDRRAAGGAVDVPHPAASMTPAAMRDEPSNLRFTPLRRHRRPNGSAARPFRETLLARAELAQPGRACQRGLPQLEPAFEHPESAKALKLTVGRPAR
ncbi:MAG TPA: hypothetical protein VFX25_24165 [Streptosporangiaceae bacterium]|nr:hypothetical protein [Streptosporangiaceae bacterium]